MRRIGSAALVAALALVTIGTGSALAAYSSAMAEASFYSNTGRYLGTDRATTACTTTTCSVTLHMSRSDRSKFIRLCGGSTITVTVPELDIVGESFCGLNDGPPYGGYVQIRASLSDSTGGAGWSDAGDVSVVVTAVAP